MGALARAWCYALGVHTSRLRLLVLPPAVAAAFVLLFACGDDSAPCHVDTDCPTGNICRGGLCGQLVPDASTGSDAGTAEAAPSCSGDGVICTLATECCSNVCAESRCATTAPTTPSCKGLYQTCQNDCCAGYACVNGACR